MLCSLYCALNILLLRRYMRNSHRSHFQDLSIGSYLYNVYTEGYVNILQTQKIFHSHSLNVNISVTIKIRRFIFSMIILVISKEGTVSQIFYLRFRDTVPSRSILLTSSSNLNDVWRDNEIQRIKIEKPLDVNIQRCPAGYYPNHKDIKTCATMYLWFRPIPSSPPPPSHLLHCCIWL